MYKNETKPIAAQTAKLFLTIHCRSNGSRCIRMLYNLLAQPLTLAEPTATLLPPPVRLRAATLLPLPLLLTPPADPPQNARIPGSPRRIQGSPCRIRRLPAREGSSRSSRLGWGTAAARMGNGCCAVGAPLSQHGRRGCPLPSPVLFLLLALLPSPTPTATHPSLPMPTRAGHTFSSLSPSRSGLLCFPSPHCEPLTPPLLALLAWGGPHRRTR